MKRYDTYIGHDERHGAHVIHKECERGDWMHSANHDLIVAQMRARIARLAYLLGNASAGLRHSTDPDDHALLTEIIQAINEATEE